MEEVACLTIFSIVRVDRLSALFEIVASALEKSSTPSVISTDKDPSQETSKSVGKCNQIDYEALTLPCIPFPSRYKTSKNNSGIAIPIFMTVSYPFNESSTLFILDENLTHWIHFHLL